MNCLYCGGAGCPSCHGAATAPHVERTWRHEATEARKLFLAEVRRCNPNHPDINGLVRELERSDEILFAVRFGIQYGKEQARRTLEADAPQPEKRFSFLEIGEKSGGA